MIPTYVEKTTHGPRTRSRTILFFSLSALMPTSYLQSPRTCGSTSNCRRHEALFVAHNDHVKPPISCCWYPSWSHQRVLCAHRCSGIPRVRILSLFCIQKGTKLFPIFREADGGSLMCVQFIIML